MKIVTIIGARPQFIKAAAVSRVLRAQFNEILVHTGQHYDTNMSDIFFAELEIPKPDYHLGVGSNTHARQTAAMMVGIEDILLEHKPDCLLVYGDTNSTLAGAIAGAKLHIPVAHVEAGLRSFLPAMPEEQNRILTDHISAILFCPTKAAVENLRAENLTSGVYEVGDVMCDAVRYYSQKTAQVARGTFFQRLPGLFGQVKPLREWYLATIHRAENTDTPEKVREILLAFENLDAPVIFPVHPRTKSLVARLCVEQPTRNTVYLEPVGYLDMLYLLKNARKVITDSGGLQKESYMLGVPCVTVREQTEWVETLQGARNILASPDAQDIVDKVLHTAVSPEYPADLYGQGDAALRITGILERVLQ